MSNVAYATFGARKEQLETRVASLDDGYLRIATTIGKLKPKLKMAGREHQVFDAVIFCTFGWNKSEDKVTNTYLADMTDLDDSDVADALNVLAERKIINLRKVGGFKLVSVNVNIDQWQLNKSKKQPSKMLGENTQQVGRKRVSSWAKSPDTLNSLTLNKSKTPHTPQGGDIEGAQKALEYYNQLANSSCRSAEPYLRLMTPTTARKAYTLQDVCLVTRWAITAWSKKDKTLPKPENICRVKRFDGYLSDAEKWQREHVDIDCQAVIDAYNEVTEGRMPPAELYRDREIAIRELVTVLAKKNVDGFRNYFKAFLANARDFYFGGPDGSGWCANFDTLMEEKTLRKVKEGSL